MLLPNKRFIFTILASFFCAATPTMAQQAAAPNLFAAGSSAAQATEPNLSVADVAPAPKPTPSENVTINLLHRMVERGLLNEGDAEDLIKVAESDAATARAAAKGKRSTSNAGAEPGAPAEGGTEADSSDEEDAVSVSYVPEVVKQQLRDEIRADVMEQARNENWANPRTFPTWVSRITPFADLRLRFEGTFFPAGNDNTGAFPNFNAINTGSPYDVTGIVFSPQLNVDEDRYRARIRLRGGASMALDDGFTMGVRIATGESSTPTSTNQIARRRQQRAGRQLQQVRHLARSRVCPLRL